MTEISLIVTLNKQFNSTQLNNTSSAVPVVEVATSAVMVVEVATSAVRVIEVDGCAGC